LSVEKNSKNHKEGIFKQFIDKTPNIIPNKIGKNVNRSYDNMKKGHDIFLRDKNEDCKTERIFGVERKRIDKNHNYESDLPKYKFCRKLFYDKAKNANNEQSQNSFANSRQSAANDLYKRALKLAQNLGIQPEEGIDFKSLLTLIENKLEAKISESQNNQALLKQLEGYSQELASIQAQSTGSAGYDNTNKALQMSLEMLSLYNQNYLNR